MPTHKLHIQTGRGGTATPSASDVLVETGSGYLLRYRPDAGYRLHDVLLNGASQGPQSVFFLPHIASDAKVEARFHTAPYSHASKSLLSNSVDPLDPSRTPQYNGISLSFRVSATKEPCGFKAEIFNAKNALSFIWDSSELKLSYKGHPVALSQPVYEIHSEAATSLLDHVMHVRIAGSSVNAEVCDESGVLLVELKASMREDTECGWRVSVDSWDKVPAGSEIMLDSVVLHADAKHASVMLCPERTELNFRRIPELD